MAQHISVPSSPILNGSVSALLNFIANYDTTGINDGIKVATIEADAGHPVLLEFFAEIITAFNASTSNRLTVGRAKAEADVFLNSSNIDPTAVAFYPATYAPAKNRITSNTAIWIRSNGGAKATSTLTSTNTQVTAGDTVTLFDPISGVTEVYTFVASPTVEGDVHFVTNADTSLLNLIRAINHSGTPGTDYVKTAASSLVTAATSVTSHAFAVTSIWGGTNGNAIFTSETAATLSWTGTKLASGTNGSISAGQALIYVRVTPLFPTPSGYLGV